MRRRLLPQAVLIASLAIVLGFGFAGVVRWGELLPVVVLAAAGASAVALLTASLRSSVLVLVGQTVVAVSLFVLAPARGAGGWPVEPLTEGLISGWSRLLSSTTPAPSTAAILAVPFFAVAATVTVADEVARRTRAPLLPVLPVLALLVATEVAAPLGPRTDLWILPVALGLAVGLGAVRAAANEREADGVAIGSSTTQTRTARRLRIVQVLPLLVAVALIGGVVTPRLPGLSARDPYRAREDRREPERTDQTVHPLTALAALYRGHKETPEDETTNVMVRLDLDAVPPPSYDSAGEPVLHVPLTTFDRYDGSLWASTGPYRTAGEVLPAATLDRTVGATEEVGQQVEVEEPSGPWIPALARPVEVFDVGDNVQIEEESGNLALTGPVAPGSTFDVRSLVARIAPLDQLDVRVAVPPDDRDYRTVIDDPRPPVADLERLTEIAQLVTREIPPGPNANREQIERLQTLLVDPAALPTFSGARSQPNQWIFENVRPAENEDDLGVGTDPDGSTRDAPDPIPTGHAVARINEFLYTPPTPGGEPTSRAGRGTPEQFATAYVLLARSVGLPARVAVGWTVAAPDQPGTVELHRADADAWAEVWLPDQGWVAIDPSPPSTTKSNGLDEAPKQESTTTTAPPTTTGDQSGTSQAPRAAPTTVPGETADGSGTGLLILVVALVLVVLVLLASLRLWVRRQRAALRMGPPTARIGGAWDDVLEVLRAARIEVDLSLAASEVASRGRTLAADAAPALDRLAWLVTLGVCAPDLPAEADADEAWRCAEQVHAAVRRALPWGRRLRLALDPLPLRRLERERRGESGERRGGPPSVPPAPIEPPVPTGV